MNFTSGHIRHPRVEERRQHPDQPGFGLSAQSEKYEVMPGENGVYDLRNNAILISDDAGKERGCGSFFSAGAGLKLADQVFPQLILS